MLAFNFKTPFDSVTTSPSWLSFSSFVHLATVMMYRKDYKMACCGGEEGTERSEGHVGA